MDKHQVAAILDEIGTLLEIQGENAFRCNAYHNAARNIEQLEEDLGTVVREGRLTSVPGIGETLREKITTLVNTGELPFYQDLRKKTPPGLSRHDAHSGARTQARQDCCTTSSRSIRSTSSRKPAETGRVAALKGFGDKTQQKIVEGIQFLRQMGQRVRIDQALPLGASLLEATARRRPVSSRIELCGSLRRRRETIKDIDILISSDEPRLRSWSASSRCPAWRR
jgi:DNA polymerase (family 10)